MKTNQPKNLVFKNKQNVLKRLFQNANRRIGLFILAFLLFAVTAFAHTWEIRVKQNQDGTLTWYGQSYHGYNQCGISNSGIRINGVDYNFTRQFSGSQVGESSTIFTTCSSPRARGSYASVTTPFIPGTLNVIAYSRNVCWALLSCMPAGSGTFVPPPPPVCSTCPVTAWSNTTGTASDNGTPCDVTDDYMPVNITVNHLSCGSITGDGKFTVVYDPSGSNTIYGPFNYSTGITTNVSFNAPIGTSNSTLVNVFDNDFPCNVQHGLNIPNSQFAGVVETVAPVITCPDDITVDNDLGECGAVVDYDVTASDNCGSESIIFSGDFTSGQPSPHCISWNDYRALLLGTLAYTKVTIKGSNDPIGVSVTDPDKVLQLANGLRTGIPVSITDGGRNWEIGNCGTDQNGHPAVEISAAGSICGCPNDEYIVRPCIQPHFGNPNWGGAGTATCNGPSQTLTVEFEIGGSGSTTVVSNPPSGSFFDVGTTEVTSSATDANGNTATCTFNVTVKDNEAPVITCSADAPRDTDAGVCTYTVVGTEFDATFTDNCTTSTITNDLNSTATLDGEVLAIGPHTITWTVDDGNGQTDVCIVVITVEDNEAPVINGTPMNIVVNTDPGSCDALVNWTAATVSDNCTGATISSDLNSGDTFPLGVTTVNYTASDANGNDAVATSFTVTVVDNEAPIIEGQNTNLDMNFNNGTGAPVSYTENGITFKSIYGNSSHVHLGDNDGDGSNDIYNHSGCCSTPYRLTVGTGTEFTLKSMNVKSVSGNPTFSVYPTGAVVTINSTGIFTFPVGFEDVTEVRWNQNSGGMVIDDMVVSTKTSGQCPTDITVSSDPGACGTNVSYSANATDNCNASVSFSPSSGSFFNVGTTEVTATATDSSGNTSNCTFDVIVNDNEIPVINGTPMNIVVNTDPGSCDAVVNWTAATVSDNCTGATISSDLNSGDTFPLGVTTVNYTASDANGNDAVATSFTVTVNDTEKPVITCPTDQTVVLDASCGATLPDYTVNVATDNCSVTVTQSPVAGTPYNGDQTISVTLTADDGNGNVVDCSFNVLFDDQTAPTVITQDITVQLDATGNASITPAMIDFGSTDNCEIATMTLDITNFDCSNIRGGLVYKTSSSVGNQSWLGQLGMEFNLSSAISVNSLGAFDHKSDGIAGTIRVGIFNRDTQTVVSGLEVSISGSGDPLVENHRVRSITPVVLPPGNYIIAAKGFDGTDRNGNSLNASTSVYNINGAVQFVGGGIFSSNSDVNIFDYPTINDGGPPNRYMAGTFGSGNVTTLTVTDVNGNVSTGTATVTVEDNVDPIAIAKNITLQLDATGNASITPSDIDNDTTPSNDACGIQSLALDITTFDCNDVGDNTVVLTVTDNNNNVSTASATVTVEDNVEPNAIAQNITVQLDATGNVSITPSDIDNDTTPSNDACGIQSLALDITTFDCNDVGPNTVTLTVTDNNNNVSTASATVTVEDNVEPNAIAQNITVQLDATGNVSITPSDIDNDTTPSNDACGIQSLALDITTFDCNDVGANTVVLTVTDNNNNVSTASATVTVEDNVEPNAIAQNITLQLDATGNASITPSDIDNDTTPSNDACGIQSLALDITTFDCNDVGANTVVLTVTDNNNNVSTASATVTVEDNVEPNAIAQNITVQLDATGNVSITPSDIDNDTTPSNDACGIQSLALDITTFDCNDVGANTVVLTVTDNNNNVSTASATVTVEDNVEPNAIAQNITVQLDATGNASITPSDIDNDTTPSNDACGIQSLALDITTFDCNDVGANTVVLTVTDNNNNVSTASATVTVEDNVEPNAIAQNITVQLDATGNASITPSDIDNDTTPSNDACGIQSLALDITTFDCNDVGPNTVTLTVTDNNNNVSTTTAVITVEDNVDPIITCAPNDSRYIDPYQTFYTVDGTEFNATATDACGIDSITYTGGSPSTNGSSMDGVPLSLGTNTVSWTALDVNGNDSNCTTVVEVIKRPTSLIYNGDVVEQYSDSVDLSATLTDDVSPGGGVQGKTITFTIGIQSTTAVTNASGVASTTLILTQDPAGIYTVNAEFTEDASYLGSSANENFDITQEDAIVEYTGQSLQATAGSNSEATVVLSANIQDITVNTSNTLYDAYAGDIRNAKVMFVEKMDNGDIVPISGWIPVTDLIDPADNRTGTVSYNWTVNIGNLDSESFTVGIIVNDDGYYLRNSSEDDTVVTIYKPTGEFITGGGYILPNASAGQYASTDGLKTNFGFNAKYTKKGNRAKGHMNIIFRRLESDGIMHVYQIKSNAVESLGIDSSNEDAQFATFTSKANLKDITDPLNNIELGGGHILKVDLTDRGEPGEFDSIAFTLMDNGTLLYSSNWTGIATDEMQLTGGNLKVHSGSSSGRNSRKAAEPVVEIVVEELFDGLELASWPNPSDDYFNLKLRSKNTVDKIYIQVFDLNNRLVSFRTGVPNRDYKIGATLEAGLYFVTVKQGNATKVVKLIKH